LDHVWAVRLLLAFEVARLQVATAEPQDAEAVKLHIGVARLQGCRCKAAWLQGCYFALHGCKAVNLGCMAARLQGCYFALQGCMAARLLI